MKMRWLFSFLLILTVALTPSPPDPQAAEDGVMLDRIVAVVEDDVITRSELEGRIEVIKRQLAERGGQLPPTNVLERQVLERMVIERLQLQTAAERGIRIDDLTLNQAMHSIAGQNNMNLRQFRDALIAEGLDYIAFREQVRDELAIQRLHNVVVDSEVQVTDEEIDDLVANRGEIFDRDVAYRLAHILVSLPEGASPEEIQAAREKAEALRRRALNGEDFAQLAIAESGSQDALEGGDLGWRKAGELPTIFAHNAVRMEVGGISEVIRSSSGFHIIRMTDQRGGERAFVNQTHARHILIKPTAILSDEEARRRLEVLNQRIEGGDSFATLAKAHSDDKASAVDGGDLGWVNPGEFVSQFEEVMDGLSNGEISEPFRSPFGWHIVQVLDRRRHDSTEEFLRNQARSVISKRKAEEELDLWLRRLRDESYVEYRLKGMEEPQQSG